MTTTLKIEHAIVDFETWRGAFDRDPVGRERLGVRRYRVCRPSNDPNYVLIDLDFDDEQTAATFLSALQRVWSSAAQSPGLQRSGASASTPRARIVHEVDARCYPSDSDAAR